MSAPKAELVETLLAMLAEFGAETLQIVPSDDDGNPLGMILVVAPSAVEDFKTFIAQREQGECLDWGDDD